MFTVGTLMEHFDIKWVGVSLAFLIQFTAIIVWGTRIDAGQENLQALVTEVREQSRANRARIGDLELQVQVDKAVREALEDRRGRNREGEPAGN